MMELILFSILGLCIGSFLNVLIIRIPKGLSISLPASHCPTCKHPLKWYHNIPLFSWIFLLGKCSFCKNKISMQYPLVELFTTFIFIYSYTKNETLTQALVFSIMYSLLLALSVIDLKYKAVPDNLSIPTLVVSLFTASFLISLNNALLFAGGFALLRILVSWVMKKEAMGEADIIIAAIIGATLGVPLGLAAIYISALIALPAFLIVSKRGFELPFIPFLTLGLFITWVFESHVQKLLDLIYG